MDSSPVDEATPFKFSGAKKSRLNLLNPMSLLARRRSSQNQNKLEDVSLHVTTQFVPAIPDDYDPRIRGNIVHDFSKPRPRRIQTSLDSATLQLVSPPSRHGATEHIRRASDFSGLKDAPSKRNSQSPSYSPVFKEHFQDDRQNLRPAQTGYLHSLALSENNSQISSASVPAFAKKLPVVINKDSQVRGTPPSRPPPPPPKQETQLQAVSEGASGVSYSPPEQDVSLATSPVPRSNTPPSVSSIRRASGLPKHMTSTSSRFSFIANGDSAAQEKLLEERHKQHASNNKSAPEHTDQGQEDDDYDDYDLDADDDLEERIPGVNAEGSDEEETRRSSISLPTSHKPINLKIDPEVANDYARNDNLEKFSFTPDPSVLSSVSTAPSQPTPRDEEGRIIGLADTSYSPRRATGHQRHRSDLSIMQVSSGLAGLGLTTLQAQKESQLSAPLHVRTDRFDAFKDEDIYFDDGEFGDLIEDVNNEEVDERIFDEGSEAVRDIPAENARKLELAQQQSSTGKAIPGFQAQSMHQLVSHAADQEGAQPSHQLSVENGISTGLDAASGLTEGNLAAYHAALVSAADIAAANGRFTRSISNSRYSETQTSTSQIEDSPPGLSDDKRNSHNVELSGVDEDDGFDFDDNDVDDLIAEANAEVLENDDDGFYGQEFGFYARAKGKNASELEYGGYFAPRGFSGVKRSHSAKANFPEPSLTPITEKSEWSARNSVVSLQIPGIPGSAQSIPSPGIAQLLDFEASSFDENMSFEALMKLRRGTFGGSSTSINSLGGPPNSSPLGHVPAHSFAGPDVGHRMTSSIHSLTGSAGIPESEEEEDHMWEEPTFTRNTPTKEPETLELRTPESTANFSPLSTRSEKGRGIHSRSSSGAESVSYVRDTDGRWLQERRRTSDDGEGELIEREYLAGSRI